MYFTEDFSLEECIIYGIRNKLRMLYKNCFIYVGFVEGELLRIVAKKDGDGSFQQVYLNAKDQSNETDYISRMC